MVKAEHTIVVERPLGEVFAYVTDVSNLPAWQSGVVEAEAEAPLGRGATFREVRTFLGKRMESTIEVTEYERDRLFTIAVRSGPVPFEVRHTFEHANGGTRLTVSGSGQPGRFFKLAEPIVRRAAARMFESDFANLKDILEARGG
jgi:ligand-binding SRPBCC domain-containing protein